MHSTCQSPCSDMMAMVDIQARTLQAPISVDNVQPRDRAARVLSTERSAAGETSDECGSCADFDSQPISAAIGAERAVQRARDSIVDSAAPARCFTARGGKPTRSFIDRRGACPESARAAACVGRFHSRDGAWAEAPGRQRGLAQWSDVRRPGIRAAPLSARVSPDRRSSARRQPAPCS